MAYDRRFNVRRQHVEVQYGCVLPSATRSKPAPDGSAYDSSSYVPYYDDDAARLKKAEIEFALRGASKAIT